MPKNQTSAPANEESSTAIDGNHITPSETTTQPRYPDIKVELVGNDGNAFIILGAVVRALRKHQVPAQIIGEFEREATSGDYDHLLRTCMEWVDVG